MITQDLINPAIISAVVAGLFAVLMKFVDFRKESRNKTIESTDNERRQLSEDEKNFRFSIIEELRLCKEELRARNDKIEVMFDELIKLKGDVIRNPSLQHNIHKE